LEEATKRQKDRAEQRIEGIRQERGSIIAEIDQKMATVDGVQFTETQLGATASEEELTKCQEVL
jgi:hypothetical protein